MLRDRAGVIRWTRIHRISKAWNTLSMLHAERRDFVPAGCVGGGASTGHDAHRAGAKFDGQDEDN